MTEKVPTDATRPMTRHAITARVCPGLRRNCRATYFTSMATGPGSRAAANPRRSRRVWKDAWLSTPLRWLVRKVNAPIVVAPDLAKREPAVAEVVLGRSRAHCRSEALPRVVILYFS